MKITKTVEQAKRLFSKSVETKFFVDGILVATTRKYQEQFCTIDKRGIPSNLRNKTKWAKDIKWDSSGLILLLGDEVRNHISHSKRRPAIFQDDYPDLNWGDTGTLLTAKRIKTCIEEFRNL